MKRIMFILILVSSLWSEEIKIDDVYEIYITKTTNIEMTGVSKEKVFFGRYDDLIKKQAEELKTIGKNLGNGATSGLSTASNGVANSMGNASGKALGQGLGMGLGIGLVYGLIDVGAQAAMKDEVFILVNDYTNSRGEKTRIFGFYCANNFDEEKVINSFLEQEINKKYGIKV